MAAQVVWRVTDTAQALFDVDDYKEFVMAQIEAAVRSIGSRYPYDDIEHQEVTLRGNHDEVGVELRKALIERLSVAGKIGSASCRERECQYVVLSVVAVSLKKKTLKHIK